jgi:hypothetical protein
MREGHGQFVRGPTRVIVANSETGSIQEEAKRLLAKLE